MQQKPKVLIGLPTMGNIHILLSITIMSWITEAHSDSRVNLSVYPTMSVVPVDRARVQIVDEFMKSDCTHLLFIDSDTIPPQTALYDLLKHDKPVVSALTPIIEHNDHTKQWYKKWNCVNGKDEHVKPNQGLVPIKGAGSSCILIRRDVFEKIEKPYYSFLYKDDNGKDVEVSEDIHFIIKCLQKGIECFADTDIICKHSKSVLW